MKISTRKFIILALPILQTLCGAYDVIKNVNIGGDQSNHLNRYA